MTVERLLPSPQQDRPDRGVAEAGVSLPQRVGAGEGAGERSPGKAMPLTIGADMMGVQLNEQRKSGRECGLLKCAFQIPHQWLIHKSQLNNKNNSNHRKRHEELMENGQPTSPLVSALASTTRDTTRGVGQGYVGSRSRARPVHKAVVVHSEQPQRSDVLPLPLARVIALCCFPAQCQCSFIRMTVSAGH
jgi:hypothetical protein